MPSTLQRLRNNAFRRQGGACYYCLGAMWLDSPRDFIRQHPMSPEQAARHRCTAEHLIARAVGGKVTASNIVAACLTCNQRRHRMQPAPTPDQLKALVIKQIHQGHWHRKSAYRAGCVVREVDRER